MTTDTILLVDDDHFQYKVIGALLTRLGYDFETAKNGHEALHYLKTAKPGSVRVVLMDVMMPVMDGFEALRQIKADYADLPVIMLTGNNDVGTAVQAIKDGACDFIIKPANPSLLDVAIKNAIKMSLLTREVSRLKRERKSGLIFSDLIGCEDGLRDTVTFGRKAAAVDLPVLISGETGTGKELFAHAIHGESKRAKAAFLAINCGAIPENLIESVLFGHEKGAFTGAALRTIGKFREAEGGTIFLDEVGELPLDAQVKLLRVLQEKEIEPVGATQSVPVNVRIISATNRDLRAEVKKSRFREDLFFRLNVLPVTIPALRNRRQDIIPLAEYFMQRFSVSDSLPLKKFSEGACAYLTSCAWPGNVRELENLIRGAMVFFDGDTITEAHFKDIHASETAAEPLMPAADKNPCTLSLLRQDGSLKKLEEIEEEAIQNVLLQCRNNITHAAEALGIAKSTFYRKIKPQHAAT